jgi:hypothetical protein
VELVDWIFFLSKKKNPKAVGIRQKGYISLYIHYYMGVSVGKKENNDNANRCGTPKESSRYRIERF